MPYIVNSVYGAEKTPLAPINVLDSTNLSISTLYSEYEHVTLNVAHPTQPTHNKYMYLDDLHVILRSHTASNLHEALFALGDVDLPLIDGIKSFPKQTSTYADIRRLKWKPTLHKLGTHVDIPITTDDKKDVLLTSDSVDWSVVHNTHLFTVNGYIFNHTLDSAGLVIPNAAWQLKHTQIGALDLSALGELEISPLTSNMLIEETGKIDYSKTLYLDTGLDMSGKTTLLVFGGKIHLLDSTYKHIGGGVIQLNYLKTNPIASYYAGKDYIDLSSIPTAENLPDGALSADMMEHDLDVIKAWIDLEQTFIITLDVPWFYANKKQLQDANLDGRYYSKQEPMGPIFGLDGLMVPYWKVDDHGVWVVSVEEQAIPRYLFETVKRRPNDVVTSAMHYPRQNRRSRAFELEIGTQQL